MTNRTCVMIFYLFHGTIVPKDAPRLKKGCFLPDP